MRFTSIVLLIGWLAVASPTMAGLVASSFAFGSGLISIDENSGSTATIGPPIAPMNGMSANSDGQLFGGTTANFQWEFYEINPTNGAATMVNAIMPSSEDFGGIRALEAVEEIEKATGKDVAGMIIEFIEKNARPGNTSTSSATRRWRTASLSSTTKPT